ncbi:uncharacterized protein LOC129748114 [Uranotaenia lowii]|uniref:uncharacterized protein LOC129748114 n=1 Tax=Uranotaenia lowii TaxID=190385 RepID=UPI002479FBE3|nr:uncharacterized protein LOC129748114 [Uranotaenia lowii]
MATAESYEATKKRIVEMEKEQCEIFSNLMVQIHRSISECRIPSANFMFRKLHRRLQVFENFAKKRKEAAEGPPVELPELDLTELEEETSALEAELEKEKEVLNMLSEEQVGIVPGIWKTIEQLRHEISEIKEKEAGLKREMRMLRIDFEKEEKKLADEHNLMQDVLNKLKNTRAAQQAYKSKLKTDSEHLAQELDRLMEEMAVLNEANKEPEQQQQQQM